jgi:hypothetical protein
MALTVEQQAQYLQDDNSCPWCLSGDLEGVGRIEFDGGAASQRITCGDCGKAWWDIYKLTGIQEIEND